MAAKITGRRRSLAVNVHDVEALKALISSRQYQLADFDLKATVGTGTFGRVRVAKINAGKLNLNVPLALKIMKKTEIINLRQLEHIR